MDEVITIAMPRILIAVNIISSFNKILTGFSKKFLIRDPGLNTLALTGTYKNQELEEVLEEIALVLEIYFEETVDMIQVTSSDVQINED